MQYCTRSIELAGADKNLIFEWSIFAAEWHGAQPVVFELVKILCEDDSEQQEDHNQANGADTDQVTRENLSLDEATVIDINVASSWARVVNERRQLRYNTARNFQM